MNETSDFVLDFVLTERIPGQEYFWSSDWQEAEREADEDIKAGRTRRFSTAQEAINYMRGTVQDE